jgi:hypothetical protein
VQKLRADAALSPFGHTAAFSNHPQVHSGSGGAINNGNVRPDLRRKLLTP